MYAKLRKEMRASRMFPPLLSARGFDIVNVEDCYELETCYEAWQPKAIQREAHSLILIDYQGTMLRANPLDFDIQPEPF